MRNTFKPVYQLNKSDLKWPKEAYSNFFDRMIDRQSPSHVLEIMYGKYGEEVYDRYRAVYRNQLKKRINERKANKAEYHLVKRDERIASKKHEERAGE